MQKEKTFINRLLGKEDLPLISIIIASRVNEEIKTMESLEKQTYKNWEVILEYDVDNEGVSVVRNRGRQKAKGEFLLFCDNDIDFEPSALQDLYNCLRKNPGYDWAFGRFIIDNYEFNKNKGKVPEEYGMDYIKYFYGISTMSLIRASANPIYDNKFIRFDDWDLWICLDKAGHKGIFCDSLLFKTVNRPGGISAKGLQHEYYWKDKIYKKHKIKTGKEKIADIIIPHHNKHEFLEHLLKRIPNDIFNIILVSGGSFAENCNRGAKCAQTDRLIFLNDDTEPTEAILRELATRDADLVGCAQTIPKLKHLSGVIFYGIGYTLKEDGELEPGLARSREEAQIPSGFCFSIKKEVFKKLNGFDEMFINGAEDQDLGFRALDAGYTVDFVTSPIVHFEAQSDGRHTFSGFNQELFNKIWYKKRIINLLKLTPMSIESTKGIQIAKPDNIPSPEIKVSTGVKLELGGKSPVFVQGDWKHVDLQKFPHTEYVTESFYSLPFEKDSIEEIFSKRIQQRLNKREISLALKNWFDILTPGGKITLVTVDVKKAMGKFLQTFQDKYLDLIYGTQADNTEFYFNGYSVDILKKMLREVGFTNIRESMVSASYFDPQIDFILVAEKPRS
jgi:GT2 family glycosyltransferase